eukprot:TRINITY_DN1442_c0_g1_i4.p2 TRINITY_DN1442_c0_g1~~TRINITY_DN1442_c0_g1_i4.p2  ORF type:complete len:271 (+),score=41.96 TRINITY_DN1442_c0_g1_i4:42-854(+)
MFSGPSSCLVVIFCFFFSLSTVFFQFFFFGLFFFFLKCSTNPGSFFFFFFFCLFCVFFEFVAQFTFLNVADLAARAGLQRRELDLLAAADALQGLAGHRRQAAWAATAAVVQGDLFDAAPVVEAEIELPAPNEGENLVADYRSLGLTLRAHPLTLLRQHLAERRFVTAADLKKAGHHALIRSAGIVVGRQRPGTATGIVFVTLEDESGLTNVVVHPQLVEKQRRELLGSTLLGVYGQLQVEGEVVHLVAKRLVDLSAWLGSLETSSRDFH